MRADFQRMVDYLLTISPSSDMPKLDAGLASRQIAWLADLARRIDPVPAAQLRQGDPTLGTQSTTGKIEPSNAVPKSVACGPSAAAANQKPKRRVHRRRRRRRRPSKRANPRFTA